VSNQLPYLRRDGTRTQFIVDGQPFLLLAGEIHNSSASSLAYMEEHVWGVLTATACNTALVPVYWELLEPEEGHFDFTLVDGLLDGARQRGLRLVLLWFGTWKNAMSTYAPPWVKQDLTRFPRAELVRGVPAGTISALSAEAGQADARAFAALLRHLQEVDGEHTVLMMQVENEPGVLGGARDVSPAANAAYAGPVPAALMTSLAARRAELLPEFQAIWSAAGGRTEGTWEEVFGGDAPEVFMAWHTARFLEAVTAAGKAEYPLPMYANAWLVQPWGARPGAYPSGGPVAKLLDVWRAAAPSLDALAPDIYRPDFQTVCAEYARAGNPLIIPESPTRGAEARAFSALATYDALCFAPFGLDSLADPARLAETYRTLAQMIPLVAEHQGTGRMVGLDQENGLPLTFPLGGYVLQVDFARSDPGEHPAGRGLIIALSDTRYVVVGAGFTVRWHPKPDDPRSLEFLSVDEGHYVAGEWYPYRRLNGDEAQGASLRFGDTLRTCLVALHSFG
jgi:beta-galactosidase GanA